MGPADRPPRPTTEDGRERRIGVELEFAALDCAPAARLVQHEFGGEIVRHDKYRLEVAGTDLGDFIVELDSQFAHPKPAPPLSDALGLPDLPALGAALGFLTLAMALPFHAKARRRTSN